MFQNNNMIQTYGIIKQTVCNSQLELISEEITTRGYSIVNNLIPKSVISELHTKLDKVYQQQVDEIGSTNLLKKINDEDIARCPLAYYEEFLELAALPLVLSVSRYLLGENITLMLQNGIINRPEKSNYQIRWHRDLNYQHYVSSRPLAISALVCIDPFTEKRGATWVLDGSHRIEEFPSDDYVINNQHVLEADSGSVIIFDSMLFHRSGINSSNHIRRAVNHMYTPPFIRQQIDIPAILDGKYNDHEEAYLLGYQTQTERSIKDWRMKRINALE